MLELFKVIPPNLFRPLAAPGAPVYARALFTLFTETRRHQQPLSRDLALGLVAEILSDPEAMAVTSDIEEETEDELEKPGGEDGADGFDDEFSRIQSRSGALLRALARYGWLRVEMQSDFSQSYILPDYAFRLRLRPKARTSSIRPESYRPWFIGSRAQRSQIEARERELEEIRGRLLAMQP